MDRRCRNYRHRTSRQLHATAEFLPFLPPVFDERVSHPPAIFSMGFSEVAFQTRKQKGSLLSLRARPRKPLLSNRPESDKRAGQKPCLRSGRFCDTMFTFLTGVER